MGKNTMMKRSIRLYVEETGNEIWSALLPYLVGNVGLVFTTGDLSDVREQIQSFQVRIRSPPFGPASTHRTALMSYSHPSLGQQPAGPVH